MSPLASSAMAPASRVIAAQFGVTNPTVTALLTSMFVAGYGKLSNLVGKPHAGFLISFFKAFGPLILGPLSEVFGRVRVLQAANFWFLGMSPLKAVLPYIDTLLIAVPSFSVELRVCFCAERGGDVGIPVPIRVWRQRDSLGALSWDFLVIIESHHFLSRSGAVSWETCGEQSNAVRPSQSIRSCPSSDLLLDQYVVLGLPSGVIGDGW